MAHTFLYPHSQHNGQGLVEYTLVLVLVALAGYGALNTLGGTVSKKIGETSTALETAGSAGANGETEESQR